MQYREARTQKIFEELERNEGKFHVYEDFLHGSDYINAVQEGKIKDKGVVLMMSIDGAQLYQCKESDCWIAIWVIFDRSPDSRYKKKHVLSGVVITGKPQNLDSFLFLGFHHLAAIQKEGLKIWDAPRNINYLLFPFLALGTNDGPEFAYLNGFVGKRAAHTTILCF